MGGDHVFLWATRVRARCTGVAGSPHGVGAVGALAPSFGERLGGRQGVLHARLDPVSDVD